MLLFLPQLGLKVQHSLHAQDSCFPGKSKGFMFTPWTATSTQLLVSPGPTLTLQGLSSHFYLIKGSLTLSIVTSEFFVCFLWDSCVWNICVLCVYTCALCFFFGSFLLFVHFVLFQFDFSSFVLCYCILLLFPRCLCSRDRKGADSDGREVERSWE